MLVDFPAPRSSIASMSGFSVTIGARRAPTALASRSHDPGRWMAVHRPSPNRTHNPRPLYLLLPAHAGVFALP